MSLFKKLSKAVESASEKVKSASDSVLEAGEQIKSTVQEKGLADSIGGVIGSGLDKFDEVKAYVGEQYEDIANTELDRHESYCSWCFEKNTATLVEENTIQRNVYACNSEACKAEENLVVQCRACSNKAKYSDSWGLDGSFCAVHAGEIANFEHLQDSLADITDFKDIVERNDINLKRVVKTGAIIVGGAVVVGPFAYLAAPAVGGALGSVMGLSGAAATSSGLATLGGGALAAGGAGMAGGITVVSAVGVSLGGTMGGLVSNSYYADIDGFDIVKVKEGIEPAIMCIDGFLTQESDCKEEWLSNIPESMSDRAVYLVNWESKRLRDLGGLALNVGAKTGAFQVAKAFALSASKNAAKKIGPLGHIFTAAELVKNPWHVARYKAEETGVLLADLIARTDQEFILMGHSLGARVIHYCLSALKTKNERKWIQDVYLLGGAVNNTFEEESDEDGANWFGIDNAVKGQVHNYHSDNDAVLKYLYNASQLFQGSAIGRNVIDAPWVENHDVTELIDGHTSYKNNLSEIINEEAVA